MALVGSSTSKGALIVYQHNNIEKGRYYVEHKIISKKGDIIRYDT